jgi:hypothetical protein
VSGGKNVQILLAAFLCEIPPNTRTFFILLPEGIHLLRATADTWHRHVVADRGGSCSVPDKCKAGRDSDWSNSGRITFSPNFLTSMWNDYFRRPVIRTQIADMTNEYSAA